jgi:hypothetical protein
MAREIYQNGIDCGSTQIKVSITLDQDHTTDTYSVFTVVVENNGRPMNKSELFDKLLQLGESSKSGSAIGGFGKAKEILYFAHHSYSIITGPYSLVGTGADYSWSTHEPPHPGTTSTMRVEYPKASYRTHADNLKDFVQCWRFVASHGRYRNCSLWINGEQVHGQERLCPELSLTDESENFRLSTCQSCNTGYVYVRSGGVYMFMRSIAGKKSYYVDLKKPGREVLTANRDGLVYGAQQELDILIQKLSNNNLSSSKACKVIDKWLIGRVFTADFPVVKSSSKVQTTLSEPVKPQTGQTETETEEAAEEEEIQSTPVERNPLPVQHSIYLSSRGSFRVPSKHWKRDEVSDSIVNLLSAWADVVKTVHFAMNDKSTFHVGLIFDTDKDSPHLAEYVDKGGCHIFLINPLDSDRRYRYTIREYPQLIGLAIHEYAHKLHSCHTESFSSHMTNVTSKAFMHMRQFQRILNSRTKHSFYFPEEWT